MLPYKFLRLPHERQIGGGLSENSVVRLQGRTFESATGFTIRLASGQDKKDDAPFLLSWDAKHNQLVVSTFDSSAWVCSASATFKTDYFQPATDFDFTIETTQDCFKLHVGGLQFDYEHKLPFYAIRYVFFDGDLNLQDVAINGISVDEEQNRIPVERDLLGSKSTTVVLVKGCPVRAKPHAMAINFTSGGVGNIDFHFNPRFNEQVLVRNTMRNDKWFEEDRKLMVPFPFTYGVAFELLFTIEEDFIFVRLNGNYLCKYERRDDRSLFNKMTVYGSVVITEASIQSTY